ncbi:hypothetical protein Bhyg_08774 [Pseudolycoriella hygida]|uniref:Uncharacterized protein n=1 Tax=Pseudolycoriella hygida TaxID=35572 RepID=A0A9Q0N702_9DIPT|nr:hypothetical protein Bhyg_08774 [Pseudolycoriella hygida]
MQTDASPCSICEQTLSLAMASSSSTGNLLPYFDFDVQRNVTVTVGQIAFFHCRVERLGDKDRTWFSMFEKHCRSYINYTDIMLF